MSTRVRPETASTIIYPESDGQPMADNTLQFRWIVTIKENLEAIFADDPLIFVAGDLLWYPVEGQPAIRRAPDAMVAFGRPKGERGSYLQWHEGGIAPQVVFEVLSPGNTAAEMATKLRFYETYGVEEYYLYDPDEVWLKGWRREGSQLGLIDPINGWVSPRLGIRFDLTGTELAIYRPDGRRFLSFVENARQAEQAQRQAEQERQIRQQAQYLAEQERQIRQQAQYLAEQAQHLAEQERLIRQQVEQRAALLEARLRALGINPDLE